MKKMWDRMDFEVKWGLAISALYLVIYAVADVCEWMVGVLL